MRTIREFETAGKPPISLRHLGRLPADATIIKNIVGQLTPKIKNRILQNVRGLFTPS